MSETMRILSQDAFAEALAEARVQTAVRPAAWPLIAQLDAQLAFLARTTADGRVPSESERSSISLGILAARNLAETDSAYADTLAELDYTFRRYPQLPLGRPARRRGVLQVWSGRHAFRKIVLDIGVSYAVSNGGVPYD